MSEPEKQPAPKARGRAAALMARLQSTSRPTSAAAVSRPTTAEPEVAPQPPTSPPSGPQPPAAAAAAVLTEAASRLARPEGAAAAPSGPRQRPPRPPELPRPPKKYAGEEAGQMLPTEVNYLRVTCDLPGGGLCQHHVSFDPDVENFRLRIQTMREQSVVNAIGPTSNYDGGSILFLPDKLENMVVDAVHPVNGQPVKVTINFTNVVQIANLTFFFNGIIKKLMDGLGWVRIGRDNHYYDPRQRHELRQHSLEIWPGFATSCKRAGDGSLLLEMDVSSHVLRSQTVLDLFTSINRETSRGGSFKDECTRQVLNQVVSTRYNNRTYKIEDIDWDKTPTSTFEQSNGNVISFLDYYRTQHGIEINDPRQPLLVSKLKAGRWGGRGRPRTGPGAQPVPERTVLLIPELCFLTGLADSQRSNFNLMRDVGEFTRLTPIARVSAIRRFIESVHKTPDCQGILDRWRLNLSVELVKVDGHLYSPETIFTGGANPNNPDRCDNYDAGDFSNHINRARPLVTVPVSDWVIVYARQSQREAQDFIGLTMQTSRQVSVMVTPPQEVVLQSTRATEFINAIRQAGDKRPSIVVIILSSRSDEHYAAVKKECNTFGLPSQCIIAKTLGNPKKVTSIVRRIFLQIEAKLGGELWGMSMPPAGLMVIGLDVFHDPGRRNPSWVAIVGSINQQQTRYYSVACRQLPGEEAAHGIVKGFTQLLIAYKQFNAVLPKKIIVFRDGLSGSQFKMSQEFEIKQIREAFKAMSNGNGNYEPEFVFIVCVKRIGVRMFAPSAGGGGARPASRGGFRGDDGGYANPPPGTVVDRLIGEPNWYDFYLISQAVRQGAVSPTHYVVIEDTSKYTATQIQRLAWKFTHLYYNWPGTVRSPAPVVYADRLAAMVGQVLLTEPDKRLLDKLFYL